MDNTLNEMKEQLQLLHHKLEQQNIVNDNLLRKVIHHNVRRINRDTLIMTIVSVISVPYCACLFWWMHLSLAFTLVTILFLTIAIVYTLYAHQGIRTSLLINSSTAEVARRIARMKMLYARWLRFSIPVIVCWTAWFAYEIMSLVGISAHERKGILIGAAVGGTIGAILGYFTYRRTQRLASQILDQIKEQPEE